MFREIDILAPMLQTTSRSSPAAPIASDEVFNVAVPPVNHEAVERAGFRRHDRTGSVRRGRGGRALSAVCSSRKAANAAGSKNTARGVEPPWLIECTSH